MAETTYSIAIVASRFNQLIVNQLLNGAKEVLNQTQNKNNSKNICYEEFWVPGAFELPLTAQMLAKTGRYQAIICLGCVIRGETTHYDYVCAEASKGISRVALDYQLPVIFGVLTTENLEQAMHRSGGKLGNTGSSCAQSAIEMIELLEKINKNLV